MMKLDEATRKWIKRHQRQYDDELEKAGMITCRKAIAIFNAMPAEQQRKLLETLFPKPKRNRSHEHEEREDSGGDTAP